MFDLTNKEKKIYFSIIRILVAIIFIIISFFIFNYIYTTIRNYPYLNHFVLDTKVEPRFNVTIDDETKGSSMFIKDEKGLRFRKPDKSLARDEWIDNRGELYYFDSNSYGKNGDLKLNGQIYSFTNGALKKITLDRNYVYNTDDNLFNSVSGTQYKAYLDDENAEDNNYYPIKYLTFGDNVNDYLGTANDKQYCTPNLLTINNNTIYYLALGNPNNFVGKLYRTKPNAENREYFGNNIKGYIILSSEVVYVYNGSIVQKVKDWKVEKNQVLDEENPFFDAINSVPLDDTTVETTIETTAEEYIVTDAPIIKDTENISNNDKENVYEKTNENIVVPIETTVSSSKAVVGMAPGSNDREVVEPKVSIDIVPR